jgi:hypothetical protein
MEVMVVERTRRWEIYELCFTATHGTGAMVRVKVVSGLGHGNA